MILACFRKRMSDQGGSDNGDGGRDPKRLPEDVDDGRILVESPLVNKTPTNESSQTLLPQTLPTNPTTVSESNQFLGILEHVQGVPSARGLGLT